MDHTTPACESPSEFFHNSRLIRWIQQNKIYKKFRDLTKNFSHTNHYTRMILCLCEDEIESIHDWVVLSNSFTGSWQNFLILKTRHWIVQELRFQIRKWMPKRNYRKQEQIQVFP